MSKKTINVLFRTSGGPAHDKGLGLGHIFRCISLANSLTFAKIYFLIEDFGKVKKLLYSRGYKNISVLPINVHIKTDIRKTIKHIEKKNIDVVIIDKYQLKNTYSKTVKNFAKTIVISDLKKIQYDADILVNGFIGFRNQIITNKYHTKCLLGPKYQILNSNYIKYGKSTKKKFSILVSFGGFDNKNLVDLFCQEVKPFLNELTVKIILGPATNKTRILKKLERIFPHNIIIMSETKNMAKEISYAQFGLCSGGITSYEFAKMQIPFAIVCQYRHQLQTAKEWEKRRVALNFGLPNSRINSKFRSLLQNIMTNNFEIRPKKIRYLDGKGTKRISHEIIKFIK